MDTESSPDKRAHVPPVPIKTYQWEDLRRERETGAYPWTHLLKPQLEGEITAEDVLRETSPRRSMSRDVSRDRTRSRTRSPDYGGQKILNLDSSPGSSRKIGDDGIEDGVNIPNFSKEVSLDYEGDAIDEAVNRYLDRNTEPIAEQLLTTPVVPADNAQKNVSPKSILKRRLPAQSLTKTSESKDGSKCCHPLVNKIKHIADKTLHKHDKIEKSPNNKRKKEKQEQSIVQLKSSPGAVRRHKFGTIKLGDSDEMSRTLSTEKSPTSIHKREHIYEDIEQIEKTESEKSIQFSPEVLKVLTSPLEVNNYYVDKEEGTEQKSNTSQDPSLIIHDEENEQNLRPEEHIMECLHKHSDLENEALVLDVDSEEPDIEEVIKNQLEEEFDRRDSPNITITEINDETYSKTPSPISKNLSHEKTAGEDLEKEKNMHTEPNGNWSKSNSDHEYEIIAKPPPNILFTSPSSEEKPGIAEDELSSTTSLERKYLQHHSDDEENQDINFDNSNNNSPAQIFQKEIEDRYFVSTPSTVSRTECDVSTSQVDSSALENLPLKRENRTNVDITDSKLHQRFKEQKEKIRSQAGKLKTKLQNMKTRQFSLPERSKFKLPQMPERPKFSMPDRRKFSLPERPKFKKINLSEKLSMGDRKKFTFPDRPKFTMPDLPKFKMPSKAKINFSSMGRKKEYRVDSESAGSSEDVKHIATVEFESRTYPRIFNRKKKSDPLVSSSPVLNRADTPPPVFNFAKVSIKKTNKERGFNNNANDLDEPREYGGFNRSLSYNKENIECDESYLKNYDLDRAERDYDEENKRLHDTIKTKTNRKTNEENASSMPDVSLTQPKCTHVINEINNDEFFVRPKGISRENIEVRQYLSDEIREAFKMPSNALAQMGADTKEERGEHDIDREDADPELYLDEEPEHIICKDSIDNDDGYYTFPPVRPSRAKKCKKVRDCAEYTDYRSEDTAQYGNDEEVNINTENINFGQNINEELGHTTERNQLIFESKTLPLPPKRKKKSLKCDDVPNSLSDLRRPTTSLSNIWNENRNGMDDIIVYRTEHSYIVPETNTKETESPLAPRRRNRSRSSHGTSIIDDDRTSHGADSLVLDQNISAADQGYDFYKDERPESPGYATVEKYTPAKMRRSKSKTPPAPRRRKSHSSDRKYHSVDRVNKTDNVPDRPARKKSSTSLLTLESLQRDVSSGDITQYAEIDEKEVVDDFHKDLQSGEIVNKMKDRPLPPPPRPPRGFKKSKTVDSFVSEYCKFASVHDELNNTTDINDNVDEVVVEIEVSTQTDPLPDDIDYELGMEENIDISISSSLRDIGDDDTRKSQTKLIESPRGSRPASRSDKSLIASDPKIQELSRNNLGRTSPTVILVERRVSSPTRINEREEIVTEASLTVQPIDIDEDKIPEVPPLPTADVIRPARRSSKVISNTGEDKALEKIGEVGQVITDVQLDNLITQRLQVRDLDVGRLNVSELQASKILVSEIEGTTMQVAELDSKSGHLSVSGIELSPSVIDEIVKKFSELAATTVHSQTSEIHRPISREEQTQTEVLTSIQSELQTSVPSGVTAETVQKDECHDNFQETSAPTETTNLPARPPPPDLSPLLLSYLHDLSIPPASFYQLRAPRERPFSEFFESQGSGTAAPPPPTRRTKRKPTYQNDSSSDEDVRKPSPRRMPSSPRTQDISITEAGAQFFRVCQNSVSRTLRRMFSSLMSYISGNEDKKDVQMALVIFLVLIAGLIMFGLSDGRTVHHHHWEFFNPPDSTK